MSGFALKQKRRMLVVLTSPSGGGKTTIVRTLLERDPLLAYSISTTTRPPRPGEVNGKDYEFVTRKQFEHLVAEDQFLEWAEVHGNLYGTRRDAVEKILADGRDVLLDIDVQGAMSLRHKPLDAVLIFLAPPSMEVLEQRLRQRRQDPEEEIARRLRNACEEMHAASRFDYIVMNDRLDDAIAAVEAIIAAERSRTSRLALAGLEALPSQFTQARANRARRFAPEIIFASKTMADLLERAELVAASDSPVLLLGESGTGKEMLAEAIHRASRRSKGPLVKVNCGAIPPTLLESELFGHVAGAFTDAVRDNPGLFRAAHTGTIFLDEIGEFPPDLQVKLLRVLQDGELRPVGGTETLHVDVRLIAATNRDIEKAVAQGRFREDLFYRLNVVSLRMPPLRERRGDIPLLVEYFLQRHAAAGGRPKSIDPDAMNLLLTYDWPGNVRQLENAIEHAVVLSPTDRIGIEDLPETIRRASQKTHVPERIEQPGPRPLSEIEVAAIEHALEQTDYNLTRAAALLGLTRRALTYRIDKYGIRFERRRGRPKRS